MSTIESRRFALLVASGVILFLSYQAWKKDFPDAPPPAATQAAAPATLATPVAPAEGDKLPSPPAALAAPTAATALPERVASEPKSQRVSVETDRYRVELSTLGGDIRRVELKGYPLAKALPDKNVDLLDDQPNRWFVVQSGLVTPTGPIASHTDSYTTAATSYRLADGADHIDVPLELQTSDGLRVRKVYRFSRGSYVIGLQHKLVNAGTTAVSASPYVQLWRTAFAVGEEPPFMKTFTGLGLYEKKTSGSYRFRKVAYDDLADEPVDLKQTGGWLAMLQHYFVVAVIPPADEAASFAGKPSTTRGFVGQYIGASQEIPAASEKNFDTRLYIGPKLQQSLAAIAPGLELTVDYGILTPLAEPLFWLLDWFHKLTKNWGLAIILLTFAVKLAMFKLSEAQYRGMAKMKKYAPRIQELKERYGDDRERMQKAMMEMYKKEKFNPLAGCWPILVQFPVFIALYWVLLESVELRQADFFLWLNDLSAPDPYFVLPVLFGISMWAQQKLSGQVMTDPMQQRVMSIMPVMLTAFFAFFPVGLVLYWLVSNLIGIAQQWYITRKLEKEGLSHR